MNGKELLDKISDVDPKLIEDANKKPRRSRKLFIGITSGAATAAAAALIIMMSGSNAWHGPGGVNYTESDSPINSVTVSGGNTSAQEPPVVETTPKDPPKLDFSKYKDLPKISGYNTAVSGAGLNSPTISFADDFSYSELNEKKSPWNGAALETMPVYMSSATDLDLEHMYKYMRSVAAAFGISEDKLEITETDYPRDEDFESYRKIMEDQNVSEEEIEREIERVTRISMQFTEVTGKAEGIEFHLRADYTMEIIFTTPVEIPEEYNFTESASKEEKAEVLNYLIEKYNKALGYNKPAFRYERMNYETFYHVYDSDGDLEQQIVNYSLNYATFRETDDGSGKLERIYIYSTAGCEKFGDYPILTPEQAEAILKSTKYNDNDRMPLDAKILKVDLTYNNNIGSTGLIPYYDFYVENDGKPDPGKDVCCTVYTIPAVPEEFIDMETDDLSVMA